MYNEKDIIAQWNADMYDLNETYTDDVEFALTLMGTSPRKVLEIACGSGRFLVPMAKAGHDVTGLDFDEWGTDFDVVILGANFLYNIVSDMDYEQSQELMIRKSANALVVGGHVLIDCGYTLEQIHKWLAESGFVIEQECGDYQGNSISEKTHRAIIWARKVSEPK